MDGEDVPLSQRGLLDNKSQKSQAAKSSKSKKSKKSRNKDQEEGPPPEESKAADNKTPEKPKSRSGDSVKKDEPKNDKPKAAAAPVSSSSAKKDDKDKTPEKKSEQEKKDKPKAAAAVTPSKKDEKSQDGAKKESDKKSDKPKEEKKDKPTPVVAPVPTKDEKPKDQPKKDDKPKDEKKPEASDSKKKDEPPKDDKSKESQKKKDDPKPAAVVAPPPKKDDKSRDSGKSKKSEPKKEPEKAKEEAQKPEPSKGDKSDGSPVVVAPVKDPEPKKGEEKPKDDQQPKDNEKPKDDQQPKDNDKAKDQSKPQNSEQPKQDDKQKDQAKKDNEQDKDKDKEDKKPFSLAAMFRRNAEKKRQEEKKKDQSKDDKKGDKSDRSKRSARDRPKSSRRGKKEPSIVTDPKEGEADPLLFDQIKEIAEKEEAKGTPRHNSLQVPKNNDNLSSARRSNRDKKINDTKNTRMSRSRREITYEDTRSMNSRPSQYSFNPRELQPAGYIYLNAQGQEKIVKAFPKFDSYREIFENLTQTQSIKTEDPIISIIITYDSTRAITVTKRSDREYWIKQFSMQDYTMTFQEQIGGLPTSYIKCKEVEQNSIGSKFAVAYIDDGHFKLRTFFKETRDLKTIFDNELDINKAIQLNNFTMPINGLSDPFIVCSFIDSPDDSRLVVALFHSKTLMHYHFIYNDGTKELEGPPVLLKMNCTRKNFPQRAFFNDEENQIYIFYRQGQAINVNSSNQIDFKFEERMTNMDLGQMYMVNNRALITRSSSKIVFFKIMEDYHTKEQKWTQYFSIDLRGCIYYIKGNPRIQIITNQNIYFYKIDLESLEPVLDNVMFNFMACSMMLFGSQVKYGITYIFNKTSFEIYKRKYEHDFLVPATEENCEGSKGLELKTLDAFLVSKTNKIVMYDSETFYEIEELPIKLQESDTREPNEILCIQKSDDEKFLAVISGKLLVMNNQQHTQLIIFKKKDSKKAKNDEPNYSLHTTVPLVDIDIFEQVCIQFYFKNDPKSKSKKDTIIFAKNDCIFELNFDNQKITTLYTFKEPLSKQPEFFSINVKQTTVVVSSFTDGIYYNFKNKTEIDLDDQFNVLAIKAIIFDPKDNHFYMLANKFDQKLGVFLIKFHQDKVEQYSFLLKWKNKLQISDADIYILHNKHAGFRELVISYKTIYINTYNVTVVDISSKSNVPDGQQTLFRHESFQLWEQRIKGFILSCSYDYVLLSKQGIRIIALGDGGKRCIYDTKGNQRMIHSLESVSFLKVEPENFILFECSDGIHKIISVYNEFTKYRGTEFEETGYQCIYRIKNHDITLRELLIFQSLYLSKTQSHIVNLIEQQPNPSVFYKSFLELDCANMVSLLNFDSNSMKILLDEKYENYFSEDFPIFYKNKIAKYGSRNSYYFRSALDNALRNNQVGAVECIIGYIVKFQNNYVSHYLFLKNFTQIMQKGVKVRELLDSNVFSFNFDYDQWPSTHNIKEQQLRPYSGSIFDLRDAYRIVFPEKEYALINDASNRESLSSNPHIEIQDEKVDTSSIFKIRYSINLLPSLDKYVMRNPGEPKQVFNRDLNMMDIFNDNVKKEFDNFDSRALTEIIEFKWHTFGYKHHHFGWSMHIVYCLTLIAYINLVYVQNKGTDEEKQVYAIALLVGISYPAIYDWIQLCRTGIVGYLKDAFNYTDMLLIWSSIANCYYQQKNGPFDLLSQSLMIMTVIMSLIKTFFFLRIFDQFSTVVTMLTTVIFDLKIFLFFFMILNIMFSLMIGIIGLANVAVKGKFRDKYLGYDDFPPPPCYEYKYLGLLVGNFLTTLRIAFGDYDQISASYYLYKSDNIMFWFCWVLIVAITAIVFLNFIIAEASASYEKINEKKDTYINFSKSDMIREAQEMTFSCFQTEKKFPKYIIIRNSED